VAKLTTTDDDAVREQALALVERAVDGKLSPLR
jgi:hypothetical protein